jgi:hypothetical protein
MCQGLPPFPSFYSAPRTGQPASNRQLGDACGSLAATCTVRRHRSSFFFSRFSPLSLALGPIFKAATHTRRPQATLRVSSAGGMDGVDCGAEQGWSALRDYKFVGERTSERLPASFRATDRPTTLLTASSRPSAHIQVLVGAASSSVLLGNIAGGEQPAAPLPL